MRFDLRHGDSREVLNGLSEGSVDALVTDPPAGVAFMGKDWDTFRGDIRQSEDIAASAAGQFNRSRVRYGDSAGYGNKSPRVHFIVALRPIFSECLRVLKPGAHGLVWALPRTSHWTATALEDAGFEIRDRVSHLFGTGFPKSLDVSKAMDRAAGASREALGVGAAKCPHIERGDACPGHGGPWGTTHQPATAPATLLAQQWEGWGTALKPACEDWWLVRKPLEGTVAANVAAHGTGALNIDGCRIGVAGGGTTCWPCPGHESSGRYGRVVHADPGESAKGRWPANVTLSHNDDCERVGTKRVRGNPQGSKPADSRERAMQFGMTPGRTDYADEDGLEEVEAWRCTPGCAAALLDEQSGERPTGALSEYTRSTTPPGYELGMAKAGRQCAIGWNKQAESGGASRFFYVAKPDRAERDIGCEDLTPASGGGATARQDGSAGLQNPRAGAGRNGGARNIHPTVKSVDLMRWLCRLITPRNGLVLDPFMGSGSTGVACSREGLRFIGIERERQYFEIARRRLVGDAPLINRMAVAGLSDPEEAA